MATFKDTLKKWFYTSGSHKASATGRVCLLDASGEPIGSDTIENIRKLAYVDSSKYVDMGLPSGTLWAKCNLGATSETDYGWYFSWGNPDAHPQGAGYNFSETNYNSSPASSIDGNLTMAQDAASMILGQNWRMPTKEQCAELFNTTYVDYIDADGNVISTTDKRTTYNGVSGLLVRSKANGNILFFPSAGYYTGTTFSQGSGLYWASSYYNASYAYRIGIGVGGVVPQATSLPRYDGLSIRPVINN